MHHISKKKWYYPTWKTKNISDLDPLSLKAHHVKGIISDLDNTLVAWNLKDSDLTAKSWIASLKDASIPVVIVSNNNPKRVQKAVEEMGIPYVGYSLKPTSFGINRALKKLNMPKKDVILVGDQVLTDIFAGAVTRIRTVLVDPLVDTDNWNTKINRIIERPFLEEIQKIKGIEWKKN